MSELNISRRGHLLQAYGWWRRHPIRGCLLILVIPVLVGVALQLLRPDPLLQTWQVKDAPAIAMSPDGQLIATPAGSLQVQRIGSMELPGYTTIQLRRIGDGSIAGALKVFPIRTLTFSPDGQVLASAGVDRNIRLYQISDGALLHTLKGHTDDVGSVVFSPDGQILASGGDDGVVRLWHASDGSLVRALEPTAAIGSLAFRPDGQMLASSTDGSGVVLWQVSDGSRVQTIEEKNSTEIAFSPDGQILAVGSVYGVLGAKHGEVRLWRVNATDHYLEHTFRSSDFLFHIAFSLDGQLLAAAGTDTETDSPLGHFELWPPKRSILLWRTSDGRLMQTLRSPQREVNRLLFNPDGRTLISAGPDKDYNDIVCIWRL